MPINSRKLGPGTLTLGAGALAVASQLSKCRLNSSESVTTTGEKLKALSGETKDSTTETAEYAFTLDGTFWQDDPGASSVVDWSWDNMGTEQPFVFVPSTAGGREVSGILTPVPLSIGGDDVEETDMASDFTWRIKGEPALGTLP
jgi:hypothetical protein